MKTFALMASLTAAVFLLTACKSKNAPEVKKPATATDDDPGLKGDPEPKKGPTKAKPDAAVLVGDPIKPKEQLPGVTIEMVNVSTVTGSARTRRSRSRARTSR